MRRVLVDTGGIYAFVTRNDAHHAAARAFVHGWLSGGGDFLLADVVFAEAMTLMKARLGARIALTVGRELRRNSAYSWVSLGMEGERETWATFERYEDKEWSYTDCALLVLSTRSTVSSIFGFDKHLDQMPGVCRVP